MSKAARAETGEELTHLLAELESPGALLEAARKISSAGYTRWDCHSPFAIDGLARSMGVKTTILPLLVFFGGVAGLLLALGSQWYFNAQVVPGAGVFSGWEWTVSGKPTWSLPAHIPIASVVTLLFAALTTFFGLWSLSALPRLWHPLFSSDSFASATDDGFFVSIEAGDPTFKHEETAAFLTELGAMSVESIRIITSPAHRRMPRLVVGFVVVAASMSLVPLAYIARARARTSERPHLHVIGNMDFQPRTGSQDGFGLFADGRASQPYVAGTVARGQDELGEDDHFYRGIVDGDWAQTFPRDRIALDMATMKRGQDGFTIYCSPCHGDSGNGVGVVAVAAEAVKALQTGWRQPKDLTESQYIRLPHGQIFNTISYGTRTMPGYRAQIAVADRWAIIFYVRALQRSACEAAANLPADIRRRIEGQRR